MLGLCCLEFNAGLSPRRIRTLDLPITSRMLGVDLDGSGRIEPAHVGCTVGPDGSRRIQKDRLDDQMDDQGPSDRESDAASIDASPTAHSPSHACESSLCRYTTGPREPLPSNPRHWPGGKGS